MKPYKVTGRRRDNDIQYVDIEEIGGDDYGAFSSRAENLPEVGDVVECENFGDWYSAIYWRGVVITPPLLGRRCAACGNLAEGNFAIDRDGFCDGPEVPLCDACGSEEEPSCEDLWRAIAVRREEGEGLKP